MYSTLLQFFTDTKQERMHKNSKAKSVTFEVDLHLYRLLSFLSDRSGLEVPFGYRRIDRELNGMRSVAFAQEVAVATGRAPKPGTLACAPTLYGSNACPSVHFCAFCGVVLERLLKCQGCGLAYCNFCSSFAERS